ncbi:MAG: hypothetical protein ACE5NM_09295 [Sedimentisphaerales bacterium]
MAEAELEPTLFVACPTVIWYKYCYGSSGIKINDIAVVGPD